MGARQRVAAAVFELPRMLGILQLVEYEPPPREWCSKEGCPCEGLLTAEGCRRGVCIRYRAWLFAWNCRGWRLPRRDRREGSGGCVPQQIADALWELAGRYEVGVLSDCGLVVNGVKVFQPRCRSVSECVKRILEEYRRELERQREPPPPPPPDPAEELLREWPELAVFGEGWVRAWLRERERLVEIARALRKYPWMAEVIRRRPVRDPHPYMVNVYAARDGTEVCLSLNRLRAYCTRDGAVREARLELEFRRLEPHGGGAREVYAPRGLLAFAASAREYVRIL
jgi:hypothetical protein